MKNHKLVLGAVAISLFSASAYCDGFNWTGAVDSYWTNAANWTKAGNILEIPAYPQPVAIDGHEGVSLRGVARRIDSFYR